MRKREWKRCKDAFAMVRQVDWLPFVPDYFRSLQLRRFRLFTLHALQGPLDRFGNDIFRAVANLGWRMAEGLVSEDEVAASSDALRSQYERYRIEGVEFLEVLELCRTLGILLQEPDDAARNMTFMFSQERQNHSPPQQYESCLLTPEEQLWCCHLMREIFGPNGFVPQETTWQADWRTSPALALAQQMYDSRDFSPMPILADALQDAGCDNADILDHCRGAGPHVRGCWVVDLVLEKE